jgi:hypothetical protein
VSPDVRVKITQVYDLREKFKQVPIKEMKDLNKVQFKLELHDRDNKLISDEFLSENGYNSPIKLSQQKTFQQNQNGNVYIDKIFNGIFFQSSLACATGNTIYLPNTKNLMTIRCYNNPILTKDLPDPKESSTSMPVKVIPPENGHDTVKPEQIGEPVGEGDYRELRYHPNVYLGYGFTTLENTKQLGYIKYCRNIDMLPEPSLYFLVCVTDDYLSIIQEDSMIRLVAFINYDRGHKVQRNEKNDWMNIETIVRAKYHH